MKDFKTFRESTGMTQAEFVRHFGIPLRTETHWETGDRQPPEYVVNMIKKILLYEKGYTPEEIGQE
ncbi:MAG: transcriptional regulator [Alphaproteobacteria bacterium]|nr:transcriptional regulator [Alphaproteobacteria bacterium]